jgi:hypothetical protein
MAESRMLLRKIFRALVIGEWITLMSAWPATWGRMGSTPSDPITIGLWVPIVMSAGMALMIAWVAASIGLWNFRPWARTLYVLVQALFILFAIVMPLFMPKIPITGIKPYPGGPLDWLHGPIMGAIMALAWGSAVANEFRKPQVTGARIPEPSSAG